MNKLIRIIPVLLLAMLIALPIKSAFAASVTVSVRQLPSGTAQQVTCAAMQQGCVIPLTINAGTPSAQSLDVLISYVPNGGAALVFKSPSGFFYNSDTAGLPGLYNVNWVKWVHDNNPAKYNTTLLQPLAASVQSPPLIATVDAKQTAPHTPVATLEITLTPVP